MSTWDKGRELEAYVVGKLQPYDKYVRWEKGSGNQGNSGDIRNNLDMIIECKNHDSKHINVSINDWDKLISELPLGCKKTPVLVKQINDGRRFAVLLFDDFVDTYIDELYEKEK